MGLVQRLPWRPGRRAPRRDRILQKEVRWRAPECDVRVPASPVPDRAFLSTQQSDPSTPRRLGAHNGRLAPYCPLDSTPRARRAGQHAHDVRAETIQRARVALLSAWGISLPAVVCTEASLASGHLCRATHPGNSSEATAAWVARRRRACVSAVSWVGYPPSPLPLILPPLSTSPLYYHLSRWTSAGRRIHGTRARRRPRGWRDDAGRVRAGRVHITHYTSRNAPSSSRKSASIPPCGRYSHGSTAR